MRRGGILSGFHPMPCQCVVQAQANNGYIDGQGLYIDGQDRPGRDKGSAARTGDVRDGYSRIGASGCG